MCNAISTKFDDMKMMIFILLTTFLIACNSSTNTKNASANIDCDVALTFINDYVKTSNDELNQKDFNFDEWVQKNHTLTDNFKTSYKHLMDSAWKAEPYVGLDFDPILDGNAFPEKGFEIVNCDNENGYVTVKGIDWPEFVVVLKVVSHDKKLLVDGSGVINIPTDKRGRK
jgi:hypothetical protein